jgi:alpha-ribazole phosphatase
LRFTLYTLVNTHACEPGVALPHLLLVRHGLTEWNSQGRIQGHTETQLSEVGLRQAEALGRRLASQRIDAIYASHLKRAVATAEAIAQHHDLPVQVEPRLCEANYGAWEGCTMAELHDLDPERAAAWLSEPTLVAPPGGETLEQMAERAASLLDELCERPSHERIVLVGHGGSLRALLCEALQVPQGYSRRFRIGTASLSVVELSPKRCVLSLFNDRHHLADDGSGDLVILL